MKKLLNTKMLVVLIMLREPEKETQRTGYSGKNWDYPAFSIAEMSKNTVQSPRELRICHMDFNEDHQLELGWKLQ